MPPEIPVEEFRRDGMVRSRYTLALGYVYVLSNPAFPQFVKIGRSLKTPEQRAEELDQTGVPLPFDVEYARLVERPRRIEIKVHKLLADRRERHLKEWFRCTAEDAINAIEEVVGTVSLSEKYRATRGSASDELLRRVAEHEVEQQLTNEEAAISRRWRRERDATSPGLTYRERVLDPNLSELYDQQQTVRVKTVSCPKCSENLAWRKQNVMLAEPELQWRHEACGATLTPPWSDISIYGKSPAPEKQ